VNLAQRIESMAGRWQVFVAESTYGPAAAECCAVKLPPAQVKGKSAPIQVYSIRGIAAGPGNMLLTIPAAIVADDCGTVISESGMLTGFDGADISLQLNLSIRGKIPRTGPLTLQFDLPELAHRLILTGEVRSIDDSKQGSSGTVVILDRLAGREALSFLRPGCCIESGKTWEEMKRH
jgi:hypothetical protein